LRKAEARLAQVTKLVDSMLRYVRQDDAGLEAVDLRALLDETLELMRPELKTKQVELDDQLPASLPLVSANRIGLQQVIANLIKNAIDALEDTNGKRIHISGEAEAGQVRIAIADNGPGFPTRCADRSSTPSSRPNPRARGRASASPSANASYTASTPVSSTAPPQG
jgi:C4-dicarboxylate-specific signal transduction histidine kinase